MLLSNSPVESTISFLVSCLARFSSTKISKPRDSILIVLLHADVSDMESGGLKGGSMVELKLFTILHITCQMQKLCVQKSTTIE